MSRARATRRERLVVVSNRVARGGNAARAGGLAVALLDVLKRSGGLWAGWSGNVQDGALGKPRMSAQGDLSFATLDLSQAEYEEYYNGFANRTLWPLFHYRIDLTNFDRDHYQGYLRVNQRFAHAVAPLLGDDDLVWVHDYHLIAFGEELRRMGVHHTLGFFLHIPFPAPEVITTLPVHEVLVRALFAYDLIGFQTESDLRSFTDYVTSEAGGRVLEDGRLEAYGRVVRAGVYPIGVDAENIRRFARSRDAHTHGARMERVLAGRLAIIGVDRLDYSKGLPERFRAFDALLRRYPENRGRISFLQIAPPSRTDVPEYKDIRQELEGLSGSINGEHSEFDWTPLRYITRGFSRQALAGLYRIARIGLVTPLRDGMNLVAKEYVAAQSGHNPGVLVLSRFAGAAHRADGALIVNPYDIQGVADAMQKALVMPLDERRERWRALRDEVMTNDVNAWRDAFLAVLREVDARRPR
ncbi:MAG: alpha,alpha-trehalose-phosphate synthase (UDP-forming) [Ectothiorhodospiraceae bacterium]|nr:alpha,alpha-trehalose-phosphate synthase (UDP-forming) [Chromatiales bacterium]MCP5156736.1 alpha,alpha-trehalose-phosphate synthase (UDP-forming) [Ectothiorhodospiraceae bacterium]